MQLISSNVRATKNKKSGGSKKTSTRKFVRPSSSQNKIQQLNSSIGNQAVQQLYDQGFLQAKLKIGKPNDKYEQEADRVAEHVVNIPEQAVVQRQLEKKESIQTKPVASFITPLIQRQKEEEDVESVYYMEPEEQTPTLKSVSTLDADELADEKEKFIQAKNHGGTEPQITPAIAHAIHSIKGTGKPFPDSERAFFEPRFGADFSNVRVHTDNHAVRTAQSINARAFTLGHDVVFGAGQYSPDTHSGRKLLAHELTHVLQQNGLNKVKRGGVKYAIKNQTDSLNIQRYNKDVHYDGTKRWAERIFGIGPISEKIASEDQKVDSGWVHPTPTSVYPFLLSFYNKIKPYLERINKLLPYINMPGVSYIYKKINAKIKAYFNNTGKAIKKIAPSIKASDVLHFPKRNDTIRQIKQSILNARNPGASFMHHAAKFGQALHLYQDSFSHSFPAGSQYNQIKNRHFRKQGKTAEILSHMFTDKLLLIEKIYKTSLYGKGAVIRHLILGNYPDDYMINAEQIKRDSKMTDGSEDFLKSLKISYNIWKKRNVNKASSNPNKQQRRGKNLKTKAQSGRVLKRHGRIVKRNSTGSSKKRTLLLWNLRNVELTDAIIRQTATYRYLTRHVKASDTEARIAVHLWHNDLSGKPKIKRWKRRRTATSRAKLYLSLAQGWIKDSIVSKNRASPQKKTGKAQEITLPVTNVKITAKQKSVLFKGVLQLIDLVGFKQSGFYYQTRVKRQLLIPVPKMPSYRTKPKAVPSLKSLSTQDIAQKYEDLAKRAVKWNSLGFLNKIIEKSRVYKSRKSLKNIVESALREHKPYLLPLLNIKKAVLPGLEKPFMKTNLGKILETGGLGVKLYSGIRHFSGLHGKSKLPQALAGPLALLGILKDIVLSVKTWGDAAGQNKKTVYLKGIVYGLVSISQFKYPPRAFNKWVGDKLEGTFQKGYKKAYNYYDSICKKGPLGVLSVLVLMRYHAKMGPQKALNSLWSSLRDNLPGMQQAMFGKIKWKADKKSKPLSQATNK